MARPNLTDMPPKRTKKVRLGIYSIPKKAGKINLGSVSVVLYNNKKEFDLVT